MKSGRNRTLGPELKTSKGQSWTMDYISSASVVSFILILALLSWNFMAVRWSNIDNYNKLYATAIFASENLVNSRGYPPGWENAKESDIISIGLADESNVLNDRKLERMDNISRSNYTMLKQKMASSRYEFYVNISSSDRKSTYYEFGLKPLENQTIVFERLALVNNTPAIVKVILWD